MEKKLFLRRFSFLAVITSILGGLWFIFLPPHLPGSYPQKFIIMVSSMSFFIIMGFIAFLILRKEKDMLGIIVARLGLLSALGDGFFLILMIALLAMPP
jgi:hypothetical protein